MVTDFKSRGNSLVEAYKKGLEGHIDSHRADNDRRRQTLVGVFEKAQADRATTSKGVVKHRVQDMKAQWETKQEVLKGKMVAALAACVE